MPIRRPSRRPPRRWLGALLVLVALGAVALGVTRFVVYQLYPLPYQALVLQQARAYGQDPLFLAAVVRVESKWDPRAVSSRGARGLMQIMPETGLWAAGKLGMRDFHPDQLYRPEVNLRIGAWYLEYLRGQFQSDPVLALAAYNGGATHVKDWLAKSQWTGEGSSIDQIPFTETRNFVRRVLVDYRRYQWLYDAHAKPRWTWP